MVEQERSRFEFSPENPPPLEVLESKIFAVHTTPILPENGILKAGARDASTDREWQGDEPPSFRPTIHFALGELVQEHRHYEDLKNSPYAIISPLKILEGQLINIFPHDTFVLGDLQLQEGMVILVPKGTDASRLPQGVEVREYDPKTGLREAVDSMITDKQGWHIRMKPGDTAIGSTASIEDVGINDSKFFKSLFEQYPAVSFGTHLQSERGDAFRFGVIEQALHTAIRNYSRLFPGYSTAEASFFRSLIVHNVQELEQAMEHASLHPKALSAFQEKKAKVLDWLSVIDCDLEIRHRSGQTFAGAPEPIQKMIWAKRSNATELRKFVDARQQELPQAVEEDDLSPMILAGMLSGMSTQELEQFKSENEMVFSRINLPEFYLHYASARWIIIKNEQAQNEGLDQLLAHALERLPSEVEERAGIFIELEDSLNEKSSRLEVALTILRNPSVRQYLAERFGMQFEEGGPFNLRDVIATHPKTRIVFESQDLSLTGEEREIYQLLDALGKIYKPEADGPDDLKNFELAYSLAIDMRQAKRRLREQLDTASKPMNTARNLDDLLAGTTLTLYESLRKDGKPIALWRRIGLDREYRRRFKTDSSFWSSGQSLIEIYRTLKADWERSQRPE